MNLTLVRFAPLCLAIGIGLTGCLDTRPVPLYRLDNGDPQVPDQLGAAVLVGPVTLADYLQRDAIVQRQADGSLSADPADGRWAGSLSDDVTQLLLRQLAWRLDSQRLSAAPASEGFDADFQVELTVTRLDSGPQHPAVLEAQWRLLDEAGKQQGMRMIRLQERHDGTTAGQVQAQSLLLQRLSEELALAIQPKLAAREEAQKRALARRRAAAQPKPESNTEARPALKPLRTDLEVYRF